ncbi:MAG: FdhF/YdeP family oxidoreductase [Deinococcales bacterium]
MAFMRSRPKRAVRPPKAGWDPSTWATRVPLTHTENFQEVFRAAWENRDRAGYAWRILSDGVCDGCALGTSGMSDWTIDGVHLCNVRLRLLRLNTMGPLDPARLADVSTLAGARSRDLRALGRLPQPMIRRRGEAGFAPIGWDDAIDLVAERLRATDPDRSYLYLTSRGIPNETYYVAQKVMRALGTNNIDNAARVCHSPSTVGLKGGLGVAATTISYTDLIGTDVVSFIGSNVSKNQPVVMKYLYHAKKAGTKIVTINPYVEPGMDKYWIPSDMESALFGTSISDRFYRIAPGGDQAFLRGTLKAMIEAGSVDRAFIDAHTEGFEELQTLLDGLSWDALEKASGLTRGDMESYAALLAGAERAVFVWGMGITQHAFGEENVRAVIDLALSKGFVGREGCGLMPIRGHSGVQGGAEMGAYSTVLPGGRPTDEAHAAELSELYGFPVPTGKGLTTPEMLEAAREGRIDVLMAVGGNFREVMPGPGHADEALAAIGLRVHLDIMLSSQMLQDPADTVLLLPATTRYEMPGGVTETSTERRIVFSPEVPGPRIAEARPEWEVLSEIVARARPDVADKVRFTGTPAIRQEIARVIPSYDGIQALAKKGQQVQYGGPRLCDGWTFPTASGKAQFMVAAPPELRRDPDTFVVVTRRGKQFNSIVHEDVDPMDGMPRDAVIVSAQDAGRLGLHRGDAVVVANEHGAFRGRVFTADVASGSVQLCWPEANVLVDPGARSPNAQIPAYKDAQARIHRAGTAEAVGAESRAAAARLRV